MTRIFRIYLLPGLVFQSVLMGGGYGTGREIVEFFLSHGPMGGLLGMGVTVLAWCFLLAVAFEFARMTKAYDYRTFFRNLIGPLWPLFEISYLLLALLVIAVVGAAAGEIFAQSFGIAVFWGTLALIVGVALLAFWGSATIEKALSWWSVLLYAAYAVLLVWVSMRFGDQIGERLAQGDARGDWALDGAKYATYNLVVLAPLLFALRHIETRRQAFSAGILASIIGMVPALFVMTAMLASYPDILSEKLPIGLLLNALDSPAFALVFQIILFGTFIETGIGLIHSINERIAATLQERGRVLSSSARLGIAIAILLGALLLADGFGVIALIASGYEAMSHLFLFVVVLPIAIIGTFHIVSRRKFGADAG